MHYLDILAEELRRGTGDPVEYAEGQWPELKHPEHGLLLDDFQKDIMRSVFNPEIKEVFCKGASGTGKGAAVAMAACIWYRIWPSSKIIVTANTWDHAHRVLFGEIAKWYATMVDRGTGQVLAASLADPQDRQHYLQVLNPQKGESFSGHHGPATLGVFDEASGVFEERYLLALTQIKCLVAISNPRVTSGWFYKAFSPGGKDKNLTVNGRRQITVGAAECRNVCEGRELIPNQVTAEKLAERRKELMAHGGQRWVTIFVDGHFPEEDPERQLIFGAWLDRCVEAWDEDIEVEAVGLDIAASADGDESVMATGGRKGCSKIHAWKHQNTMATVGKVLSILHSENEIDLREGEVPICVDADGLGKGVADRLDEIGCRVLAHRGGERAEDAQSYGNRRAETYGELARRLDPEGRWGKRPWALPDDPMLLEELAAPEKIYDSSSGIRFKITPKERHPGQRFTGDPLRVQLGRSPDRGDAVAYLFAAVREFLEDGGPHAFVVASEIEPDPTLFDDVYAKFGM